MSTRSAVAIIGGGVAGAVTAIQLARRPVPPDVVLLDRAGTFGRGIAYATESPAHLLNVPALRMSLFSDEPEHFLNWAHARLGATVAPDAFLPRSLYGAYVAETLAASAVRDDRRVIRLVHAAAVDVAPGRPTTVCCADGTRVAATHVVFALGNEAAADPPLALGDSFYASARYVRNAWRTEALAAIAADDDVLLMGTGLTMYDVVLALRERGHRGTLHAVSRHGLLPRPHAERPSSVRPGPPPERWLDVAPTAAALLRAVRAACEAAQDWHGVVDSLRSVTVRVWERLDARERTRFLARVRPYWDVYRHRAPLVVHRRIEDLVAAGRLQLHRGRIRALDEGTDDVTAVLDREVIRVAHVVNCTGPNTDVRRSSNPLVRSLRARGLIVPDRHGLGVETAADGALVGTDGHASTTLFTLGTWRRAGLWESVAVPELRAQAAELARRLTDGPDRRDADPADGRVRLPGIVERHAVASALAIG